MPWKYNELRRGPIEEDISEPEEDQVAEKNSTTWSSEEDNREILVTAAR